METSVAVLVDAKREYTNQLIQAIRPFLLSGMLTIYDEAFNVCQENKETDLTMLTFQELLGEIPKWNIVMITEEAERIITDSKCDFLEDLLTAVFVCHTKILTTVRVTDKERQIDLQIPCVENFLHQVYIEMAREFWKHPYLLNPVDVSKLEYQQNLREAENIIHRCLESTIRRLLPVKDILKKYLVVGTQSEEDDNIADYLENDTVDKKIGGEKKKDTPHVDTANDNSKSFGGLVKDAKPTKSTDDKSSSEVKTNLKEQLSNLTKDDGLTVQKQAKPVLATTTTTTPFASNAPSKESFDVMLSKIEGNSSPTTLKTSDVKTINTNKPPTSFNPGLIGGGASTSSATTPLNTKQVSITTPTLSSVTTSATPPTNPLSPLKTSPLASPLSPTKAPSEITSLSLDSLGNTNVSSKSPSEISLDSLGHMDEVNVDFGRPSTPPSIKSDVMAELNLNNTSASPVTSPVTPHVDSSATSKPFQFF